MTLVDRDSEEYRRFAELYKAARALRPNETDLWKGDLYATTGEGGWGAFQQQARREVWAIADRAGVDSIAIRGLTRGLEASERWLAEGAPWGEPPEAKGVDKP